MFDKLEIAKGIMDQLKLYINPEIYKLEHDEDAQSYEKINSEFKRHSYIGKETGKMQSKKPMLEAIQEFEEWKKNPTGTKPLVITGKSIEDFEKGLQGLQRQTAQKQPVQEQEDEEELG